ncbi:uncharacterized protein G2W53_006670 [Senna tora]|uniref:Uncharacterized protein n=1 Tax=Senna tora TaxID=362788 RepID=A0A834X4R2_9FABA|nr:uncharacterized protein G2W53_006670 [Senna tora]
MLNTSRSDWVWQSVTRGLPFFLPQCGGVDVGKGRCRENEVCCGPVIVIAAH